MENINLAIVEDDPIIRESLESYLNANPTIQIQLACSSVEDFFKAVKFEDRPKVDLLLLDIGLPGMTGIEGIRHIR